MEKLIAKYPNGGKEMIYFFEKIYPISQPAMEFVMANTSYVNVKKGKYIREPTDGEEMVYFVVSGLLRGFLKTDDVEITTWINEEYNMIGSIRSMGLDVETGEYIQALEDTLLIAFKRSCLDELYDRFSETNIIGRKVLEVYYRDAEERAYLCRLPSAEKRYRRLAETRNTLFGRVALRHLASYLGMKKETLCRIRAKYIPATGK
ncbi:Crp/Fnr family transcriptional regulator [Sphingobacterium pedocola]|uniref:Crp/Fnr family transcriptional regulator n=1 Tax=Sphingobacterium pedocola TaxID=2082722 RepID=A0ABR9T2C6_9SPHI|nr:Crp/Fnr family transcriptional regulator [Sphingobacterium pedocola]MBE8719425.1 Crp/Fnr family transcriptional regulator [Sphingobacterium pedocola]